MGLEDLFEDILRTANSHFFVIMSGSDLVPLIHIPETQSLSGAPPSDVSNALVKAFQSSGFALITTPLMPLELQVDALEVAKEFFDQDDDASDIEEHPTDPKRYTMIESHRDAESISPKLAQYYLALEKAKTMILSCIAIGLDMESHDYLAKLHDENNSCMRLLQYPKGNAETGNRCKEHSDYGTITLLCTDGVSGLEIWHGGQWLPVPHVKGALVVNVGSLLSDWTGGSLLATLHRVAGPASLNSSQSSSDLMRAVDTTRISIAFFADPNPNVATHLNQKQDEQSTKKQKKMSVAEYIQWRSGGTDANRSGVTYTNEEHKRATGS